MRGSLAIVIALGLLLAMATPALAEGSIFAEEWSAYGSAGSTTSFSAAAARYGFGDLAGGYIWGFEALANNVALAQFHSFSLGAVAAYTGGSGFATGAPALSSGFGGSVVGSIATGFEVRGIGLQSVESYSEHTSAAGNITTFSKVMQYNSGP